jgi:hypothetical protein
MISEGFLFFAHMVTKITIWHCDHMVQVVTPILVKV